MTELPPPLGGLRRERERRLARIKRDVAAGRYHIPAEAVADALLAEWRGEAGPFTGPPAGEG